MQGLFISVFINFESCTVTSELLHIICQSTCYPGLVLANGSFGLQYFSLQARERESEDKLQ